jgi:hypothetical protein
VEAPYKLLGLQPYVLWDFYWGAVGAGGHLFTVPEESSVKVMGSAYLRGGPTDIAFIEGSFMWPGAPVAASAYRLGLGGTMGPAGTLRLGVLATTVGPPAIYVEPMFNIQLTNYLLTFGPYAALGFDDDYYHFGGTVGLEVPLRPPDGR